MGLLALAAGAALLLATAFRVVGALGVRSGTSSLLAVYTMAWSELILTTLVLSAFGLVTAAALLSCFAGVAAVTIVVTQRRARQPSRWRQHGANLRDAFGDPVLLTVGVTVLAGLVYVLVLTSTTVQNDDDTVFDHLFRAALWKQHHAVGYPVCACAPYINTYPPNGEIGSLFTMVLGRGDRFVGLVQTVAYAALSLAVFGLGRRLGLSRREALFGGLLVATLPVIALQASTAQNDLVVASFLGVAVYFLVDGAGPSLWIACLATALAVGTKLTALLALPLLGAVALVPSLAGRRRNRVLAVAAGSLLGAYWYGANIWKYGSWDAGFPSAGDHSPAAVASRLTRFAIEFVDVPGARGRDVLLYAVAGGVVAVVLLTVAPLGRGRRARITGAAIAAAVALTPLLLRPVAHALVRANAKVWLLLGHKSLGYVDSGRDITRAAANFSWYGPLGSLLLVGAAVLAVRAVRRHRVDGLALVFVASPLYWLVAVSVFLAYDEYRGRFFMLPIALAASTWGIVLRHRAIAWGVAAVAVTSLALALVNDQKRPSGVSLLEPSPESIWDTPRAVSQDLRPGLGGVIRFVDARVPARATVGVAITPSDAGYVFFGRGLNRRLVFVERRARDVPGAQWVFVRPGFPTSLCRETWRRVATQPSGWAIYARIAPTGCGAAD